MSDDKDQVSDDDLLTDDELGEAAGGGNGGNGGNGGLIEKGLGGKRR